MLRSKYLHFSLVLAYATYVRRLFYGHLQRYVVFYLVSLCIGSLVYLTLPTPQYALTDGDKRCEHNDSQKQYENGIQTYHAPYWVTESYCANGYYCHDQAGGYTCIQFEKVGDQRCEHNDSQNPGENGIQTFDGNNWNTTKYCSYGFYCHQQGGGIVCNADNPTPGPPPPPCANLNNGKCTSVHTGIGNFDTDPGKFVTSLFSILLGIAGSVAVLLIVYAGYRLMTSRGNPERVQAAREQLTAAIIGLLFMLFSFVILEIIGVDILKIPGFTH